MIRLDLRQGELPAALDDFEPESCSGVISDPPYGLSSPPPIEKVIAAWLAGEDYDHSSGFLGREWDQLPPGPHHWRAIFRVLKPGGHVLAFSSSRTMGLLDLSLRLAGFEILPSLAWIYGSAMATGANIGKLIDRQRKDDPRPVCRFLRKSIEDSPLNTVAIAGSFGFNRRMVEHWAARETDSQPTVPTWEQWGALRELLGFGDEMDAEVWRLNGRKGKPGDDWENRKKVGEGHRIRRESSVQLAGLSGGAFDITAPATPLAQLFDGHHSRIRSMWEPILVARKPGLSFAENAEVHGVSGFNVAGCRIPAGPDMEAKHRSAEGLDSNRTGAVYGEFGEERTMDGFSVGGRFPGNALLSCSGPPTCRGEDHGEGCTVGVLDRMGEERGMHAAGTYRNTQAGGRVFPPGNGEGYQRPAIDSSTRSSRFFFCARASTRERSAGLDDVYWRRTPDHQDGWKRVSREEWEEIGERDYRAALGGDAPPMVQAMMGKDGGGTLDNPRYPKDEQRQAEAARERNRAQGNPHPTCKSLSLIQWLARLVLPPTIPGQPPPRLLVPYAGMQSEVIGVMLGGWCDIVSIERSAQWVEAGRQRCEWWRPLIEAGASDVAAILEDGDELHRRQNPEPAGVSGPLFEI